MGKGKLTELAGRLASNSWLLRGLDILGEGVEGGVSAVLRPLLKGAMYDDDMEYASGKALAEEVMTGIEVALFLQGLEVPGGCGE